MQNKVAIAICAPCSFRRKTWAYPASSNGSSSQRLTGRAALAALRDA